MRWLTVSGVEHQVKDALQAAVEAVELIDWMSKVQKQQALRCLEELTEHSYLLFAGPQSHNLRFGTDDLRIKSLLVQLSARYAQLVRQLDTDASAAMQAVVQQDPPVTLRQRIEAVGVEKVTRCSTLAHEAGIAFREAALFAPVGALKTLEEGKKTLGQGMLRALGVSSCIPGPP